MSRVLTVGDQHLPACRKGYLPFCTDIRDRYKCNKVVMIGDIIDWHNISHWVRRPECPGPKDEYELASQEIGKWVKQFPRADVMIGNHDERPARLARTVAIPECLLVPYPKLWKIPGWTWAYEKEIDGVFYTHGTNLGGVHPAWEAARKQHGSVVIGHVHARAEIVWSASTKLRLFGMSVGCGIDATAYQFAYGIHLRERPFLSVGVVIDGIPQLIPMPCGPGEKFHDARF